MNQIDKGDKEHLKALNEAIRSSNLEKLSVLMKDNAYPTDYLRNSFLNACREGNLPIISFLMTSKTFTPNALYARGLEDIFREKHEDVIIWLIFDYKLHKSGAVEEVLIEMSDREYANHIEGLFEKRELSKKLDGQLSAKGEVNTQVNFKQKI